MKADQKHRPRSRSKAKAAAERKTANRKGQILVLSLAVLILVVTVITASFSWFAPKEVDGIGAQYSEVTYNRSEQCSFSTFEGTKNTSYSFSHYVGQIDYNTLVHSVTIDAGETRYFRTSIVNADTLYASDVSLYFASFGAAGSNLTVAVTFPSNTVRIESGAKTDYCLVRNAFVKVHDANDVDGPGLLQVDWFVTNNGSSAVTLNLDPESENTEYANMYLMYN